MKSFTPRKDAQIMALELYAILCGIDTFKNECSKRNVIIWTDNVGGECALRKQSSKAMDHNRLVHAIWSRTIDCSMGMWINRVPSELNIADGPTRPSEMIGDSILKELGAQNVLCLTPAVP